MNSNLVAQLLKFGVVGVINTAVDLIVLNALIMFSGGRGRKGSLYTFFKGISFVVANINSYFMNKYWTFAGSARNQGVAVQASQFFAVSLVGLVINISVASLVVNKITPVKGFEKWWPTFGALCGTAIGLIWNFIGYKIIVF